MPCSVSRMLTLAWGINVLVEKLAEIGKTPFANYVSGVGDSMHSMSLFLISFVMVCTLMPSL